MTKTGSGKNESQIQRIKKGSSVQEQKPPRSSQQRQLNPPKRPTSDVSEVPSSAGSTSRRRGK